MTALQIWEPSPRFDDLLLRNAAAVISNYLDEGVDHAILSGGVFTQVQFNRLLELLKRPLDVRYFWLELPDELRAKRLISRGRDSGDSLESVPKLIAKYTSPKPTLRIPRGGFYEINTGKMTPEEVVAEILNKIQTDGITN